MAAADEIIDGSHLDQFPIDVYQTGSGTSSNMNMNEVLATRATAIAGSPVHPNDHVNASQSSNDVFPTSVHVAVTGALLHDLIPSLERLGDSLAAKADEWKSVVKSGRTHLMDATPVTLGQEFGGFARQMRLGVERITSALPRVAEVPLGGTATGTGINTPTRIPAEGHRAARRRHRTPADRGTGSLRGAGRAGRPRRSIRSTARHRGQPHQDLQ